MEDNFSIEEISKKKIIIFFLPLFVCDRALFAKWKWDDADYDDDE